VRLDDLDEPRNVPGAEGRILQSLERHGLHWDGPITRQSQHLDRYAAALATLEAQGAVFYCRCSRRDLHGSEIYPGTCRGYTTPRGDSAVRVRVDDTEIEFDDLIRGQQHQALGTGAGDFVLRRRDGIVAYQLATAVDDGAADISRVVRGRDLLATTPRQIFLMQRLGLEVPAYAHIPLLLNPAGQKLSKQTGAPPLNDAAAASNLVRVLQALGLDPGPAAAEHNCEALLADAVPRFSLGGIPHHDTRVPS
jgi:glutamyl-Q tRNA(Asp) synthetase